MTREQRREASGLVDEPLEETYQWDAFERTAERAERIFEAAMATRMPTGSATIARLAEDAWSASRLWEESKAKQESALELEQKTKREAAAP